MLERALAAASGYGAAVELFSVAEKDIRPCDACWTCRGTGLCRIRDDMQELYEKLVAADGIIIGTPIFFWGMAAQAKIIIDRSICLRTPGRTLNNKVCGVTVSCGSLGLVNALKDLTFYIVQNRMLPANQVSAYLTGPDDLPKMDKCLQDLDRLGRQMVALVNLRFKYPEEFFKPHGAFRPPAH
jgi:multimeric flavodoxin WrbA